MKISIVTISYNQAKFLRECIESVINQDYNDLEYIIVDPGSTDGSRKIIQEYSQHIDKIIFESDDGPADGLNKGFSYATGEIYGFLNADDLLLPGALKRVGDYFSNSPDVDVVSGHGYVIDNDGKHIRCFYSDPFSLKRVAYGACVLCQVATFFRKDIFYKINGFNKHAEVCWDGELWVDLAMNGAKFDVLNDFLGKFRIYGDSITGNKKYHNKKIEFQNRIFFKIMSREHKYYDVILEMLYRLEKYLHNPKALKERLLKGSIFKRI